MTGEMPYIDPVTGVDQDGEEWSTHAKIAKALGGVVKPFDKYQGPYVLLGTAQGKIQVWISEGEGLSHVVCMYYKDRKECSKEAPFVTVYGAVMEAKMLIKEILKELSA